MSPMRADQARATREHLLDVATRLFAERGYDATSIGTVLEAARVSRGALYHHFPSKEALFEAVYDAAQARVAQDVVQEAMAAGSPLEMIKIGARAWLERIRDPVVRQITLIDAPAVLGWQRWREVDEKYFLGVTRSAMQEAVGASASPQRLDYLVHMYFGTLSELAMVIARGDQSDAAIDEAAAVVDDFLTRMLS